MRYKYIVVQNIYRNGESVRTAFGIAVVEEYDKIITVLDSVSDISSDIELVEKLAERCNICQLELVHFRDVIVDFLEDI